MAKHTLFSECGRSIGCLVRGSFYFAWKYCERAVILCLKCTLPGRFQLMTCNQVIKNILKIQVRLDMARF